MIGTRLGVALWLTAAAAAGCMPAAAGSVEATVEGALRAEAALYVAPAQYRIGLLPPDLATGWLADKDTELARWFAGDALAAHRLGLRNVVSAHTTSAGAIPTVVDITAVRVPGATITGDTAIVSEAVVDYVTHFAPGTWDHEQIPGVTMCRMDLQRMNGRWFVVTEACNVSGG